MLQEWYKDVTKCEWYVTRQKKETVKPISLDLLLRMLSGMYNVSRLTIALKHGLQIV